MRVMITGANGQLGRALLQRVPTGWQAIACDRARLDLADSGAIARIVEAERPDWVINCGAYTRVDAAESDADMAVAINAGAPAAFAKTLSRYRGRLLQVSTDFVFDGAASRPYRPDDTCAPLSVYGRSKLLGESAAGPDAIVLRTSWVYAAGGSNFVNTMLRLMRERAEISVVADQTGAPSWAGDLARTAWELVQANARGIFHHRDAGETSWHGFAVAIAEEAQAIGLLKAQPLILPITTEQYPTPAQRPRFSVLDDQATRALLGDETAHWRDNLKLMLAEQLALDTKAG